MDNELLEIVRSRVAVLQQLELSAVAAMPAQMSEDLRALGKVAVAEYHQVIEGGDHMVVVQAVRERWFGIFHAIEVDGFVLSRDGTRRPLAEPEKWDYT